MSHVIKKHSSYGWSVETRLAFSGWCLRMAFIFSRLEKEKSAQRFRELGTFSSESGVAGKMKELPP